ncbi:MAG: hypothetical protein U5R46_17590 [Gammaproteobacteria bacterium]|nr:hypothetical protein [Gammaproteobacteria bacterium]
MKAENRSQLMDQLGAVQANTVWSWCAVNDEERKVYFSVWADLVHKHAGENRYTIQEPGWGIDEAGCRSPARNDHDEKLRLVFEQGYEPYGYFIEAQDPTAHPRQIAGIRTSFVMRLRLVRADGGSIYGVPLERVEL